MLFRPREKHPLLGQGLIPKRRTELVEKIAQVIEERLLNPNTIRLFLESNGTIRNLVLETKTRFGNLVDDTSFQQELTEALQADFREIVDAPDFRESFVHTVQKAVTDWCGQHFLARACQRRIVKMAANVARKWLENAPVAFEQFWPHLTETLQRSAGGEDWAADAEQLLRHYIGSIVDTIEVRRLVAEQLEVLTVEELEEFILGVCRSELGHITLLGGILGAIFGIGIAMPSALLLMPCAAAVVFLADKVLYQPRRAPIRHNT